MSPADVIFNKEQLLFHAICLCESGRLDFSSLGLFMTQ